MLHKIGRVKRIFNKRGILKINLHNSKILLLLFRLLIKKLQKLDIIVKDIEY